MEPIVKLENVFKSYYLGKVEVPALSGVSLEINAGEIVAICGPSGSGKTTLMNLMACLDVPTAGRVEVFNCFVNEMSDDKLSELRNQKIGFIFQTFNLIPVLNVYENVEYPLLICGKGQRERKQRVLKILDEVGLQYRQKHKINELSGGQQQRVAVARALVTSPRLVFADEPTANLDTATGMEILSLMNKMNEVLGTAFLFCTHDHKVLKIAKQIYYLRDGILSLSE